MSSEKITLEEFDARVPLRSRLEQEWLARWPIDANTSSTKTYTAEQEVLLISFLPEYIITQAGSDERKYWKAKLVLEWVRRWPLTAAHKKMFSTWFRNNAKSLGYEKADAGARSPSTTDDEDDESDAESASAGDEDDESDAGGASAGEGSVNEDGGQSSKGNDGTGASREGDESEEQAGDGQAEREE